MGVNTRMFFRPRDGVGVVLLTNGDAATRVEDGALQAIQDRLFASFRGTARPDIAFSGRSQVRPATRRLPRAF